jgi:hypothetical protein
MDSLTVLFWNVNRKDAGEDVKCYVQKIKPDLIVLIEHYGCKAKMLISLNDGDNPMYSFVSSNKRETAIFATELLSCNCKCLTDRNNFAIFLDIGIKGNKFLLGAVHLPSKLYGNIKPEANCRELAKKINELESELGHTNTVLFGDFNMNPFEDGMVTHDCFNSVMAQDIAQKKKRKVGGIGNPNARILEYFYNPMWSFFGDLSPFKPGTYYWHSNSVVNDYHWNMFDQILIKPALIPNFNGGFVHIFDSDKDKVSLINHATKTRSKKQKYDHLPIAFKFNVKNQSV